MQHQKFTFKTRRVWSWSLHTASIYCGRAFLLSPWHIDKIHLLTPRKKHSPQLLCIICYQYYVPHNASNIYALRRVGEAAALHDYIRMVKFRFDKNMRAERGIFPIKSEAAFNACAGGGGWIFPCLALLQYALEENKLPRERACVCILLLHQSACHTHTH